MSKNFENRGFAQVCFVYILVLSEIIIYFWCLVLRASYLELKSDNIEIFKWVFKVVQKLDLGIILKEDYDKLSAAQKKNPKNKTIRAIATCKLLAQHKKKHETDITPFETDFTNFILKSKLVLDRVMIDAIHLGAGFCGMTACQKKFNISLYKGIFLKISYFGV